MAIRRQACPIWRVRDTTPSHNGNHILYAFGYFSILPTATVSTEDYGGTTVKNLAITSCVPEGVVPWKGEEGTTVPITVNLEDNDTSDPMTLTLTLYATNADNRGPWTAVRTMIQENVTGSSYTFYWDGKNDNGAYVEPWTYTFEVDITQTDINYNENPALQVADATEYRSKYLDILRSRDAFNNPIYEAEYAGYDDGDPNDPNDDSYLYYIRFYDLKDTLDVDASEGELQLYDGDPKQIYAWDVTSLLCLDHEDYDGLEADSMGITHNLLVPIPVSIMQDEGDYRFVLHMKDDHLDKYRDHRKRWARDLNAKKRVPWAHLYDYLGGRADNDGAYYLRKHLYLSPTLKVSPYATFALGDAQRTVVFSSLPRDSIWYCNAHGSPGTIDIWGVVSAVPATNPMYGQADYFSNKNMNKCLLAIFASCESALTDSSGAGWGNLLDTAHSRGADCALGFSKSIGATPTSNHYPFNGRLDRAWCDYFFEALCWGKYRDHTAVDVQQAALYAVDKIKADCPSGSAHDFDSWETRPNNSTLKVVPAR